MLPAGEQLGKHPTLQSGGREDNIRQTVKCLDTASNVIVVVAGGFHTQGLEKILDDRKISYVSITPNITHDATASSAVYQHLLILQAMGLSVVSNRPANTLSALSAFLKQKINSVQMFARSVVNVDFKHSDALGLTITSSQPGMGQFRALAGAAMEKAVGATKIDIADLLAQLKAIDTEMGRNDQFAIENNRIVATIDGQQIRINANGTFADDTIVTDAPAGTSVATKINGEKIAVAAQSLAAWSFNQPAAVQSLLPGMLAVLLWMAEQNMLNDASEGAIYELNAEALESIAGENATNPETIAQMPEVVQKAMLAMHENTSIKGAQDNSVLQAMNTAVAMIQKSKKLSVADRRSQKGTSDIPILSNDNVEQVLTAQDWASLPQAYAWRDNAFLMTLFTLNLYSRKVIIELEQGQTFAGSLYFYGEFAECMKKFRGEINGHTGAIPLRSKNGEIKYFDLGSIKKISVLKAGAAIPGTVTTVFEPIESVEAFLEKLSATRQQHRRLEEVLYFGKIMEVIGRTAPGVLQTQKTRDALADLMIEIYKNPRMKSDLFNPIKGMVEAFLKASGISLTLTDDQIAHFIGEDMFGSAVHSESAADDPRPVNTTYFTGFRDEAKFKEGFNGLLNAVLSDNLSAAQVAWGSASLAVDNKASKDADEKSAAVSPNNAGRSLQRSLQGVPQRLGLAGVHWSEFFPMMFTPRAFDLGHGEANAARTAAIWTMFTVGWVTTIAAGLALGAWLLPLSLGFAPLVIGLAGVAAFITTGIFHVGYDMQAAIPTAFFVTENAGYLKNDPKINTALGYQPIIITRADALTFSRTLANKTLHNTGIRQNGEPVWTALENGVLTVYVSGKGAAFAQNAAEVISQLKGYANIRGSSRAVRVLSAAKGAAVNTVKPIVFDYTQNAQLYNADSIPVRTGDSIAAGYEEIINTHNAEMYAVRPEIGIKTVWSKDFLEHKEMPFNQSLVLSKDAIIEAGVDGIRALQKRGAKIYMLYESPDQNDAVTIAKKYGLNGIIYPNILAGQVEKSKNPEMWVAGLGAPTDKGVRPFQELNLNDAAVARAAIKKVPSGAVVKVTVDDKHMDALTMLNELPYDVLLLIDGEVFREAARQPNRDISQIKLFGVNILQLLHLTPTTSADKRSYERKVAFGLTIEDYKKPDQATLGQELANIVNGKLDAIENNTRFFNAVRLHRANAADPQEFLKAVAARYLLASQGKMYGLMSDDLERVFVENMREMTPAQLTTVVAQFEEANAMINTEQSGAQVNADLMVHIQKPITAGLRIALIALFADARFTGVVDKASMHQNDARLTRSILEAA